MDILKAFVLNDKEYNINILWEDDKPYFRAKEIADILEIKDIITSIRTFDVDEKVMLRILTPGGNQEVTFLTESGVYKLLMHSRKKNAIPFQKWVSKVLISIRQTGKYELDLKIKELEGEYNQKIKEVEVNANNAITKALEQEANNTKKNMKEATNNALIQAYTNKSVVYFGKIYDKEDNKFLLKIGSTIEVQNRSKDHIRDFGTFTILAIYECLTNERFEKFLHHHKNIIKYKYSDVIYGNHRSNGEVFLVNEKELNDILNIAKANRFKFNTAIEAEQIIQIEQIKLEQMNAANIANTIKETNNIEINTDDYYIDPVLLNMDARNHTQTRGDKVQRYSPDGKILIQTYESYVYAIRDENIKDMSRVGLKQAIKNKTVYKDYRWAELDRELPDDTIQDLAETVESKTVNIGFVAMLNLDKNKIEKVFSDQKSAAEDRHFKSGAPISKAIRCGSLSGGHYFSMWHDCSQELKDEYLLTNNLPEKRVVSCNVQVQQIHPISKIVLKTYSSIEDVIKEFKISRTTLKDACEFDYICKGYKWKIVK